MEMLEARENQALVDWTRPPAERSRIALARHDQILLPSLAMLIVF